MIEQELGRQPIKQMRVPVNFWKVNGSTFTRELVRWLDSPELDVFATVTLKHGIETFGGIRRLQREDIVKTAWLLRDRLTKRLVGCRAFRKGKKLPFLAFVEGDGQAKRFHLHTVMAKPYEMGTEEYELALRKAAKKLVWVYERIDICHMTNCDRGKRTIRYCLKEGPDAFLPEASFVPNR